MSVKAAAFWLSLLVSLVVSRASVFAKDSPNMLYLPNIRAGISAPRTAAQTGDVGTVRPGKVVVPGEMNGDVRNLPQVRAAGAHMLHRPLNPWGVGGRRPVEPAADTAVQHQQGAVQMPSPNVSFAGLAFNPWGAGWPPDPTGDVGPNHYVQAVNTSIGIFDKTGSALATMTFDTLWAAANFSSPCDTDNQGDPTVLYDYLSDHWIITDLAWTDLVNGPYYQCIAVSKTGDPVTGGWWFYAMRADDDGHPWLNDYPKIGLWPDAIYMSANMFDIGPSNSETFKGVRIWAMNRTDLTSGSPLRSWVVDLSTSSSSLLPANLRGALPPSGTPNYFVANDQPSSQLLVWRFSITAKWDGANMTGPTAISYSSYSPPDGSIIPEPSPGNDLDSLGDRLMMQNQYRNINGTESLWVAHTAGSGPTGIRWYQLDVTGGTIASLPVQHSTYQPDSGYRWMPSLAVDKDGNMAVGYSVSSATITPAIRYAGRLSTDPLNTLGQSESSLIEGTGVQTNLCAGGACDRWGDYSAMTVDPVDDCTFWYTNEYYVTNGGNWQTRIGSFRFPSCGVTNLILVKQASPVDYAAVGALITYTYAIQNAGSVTVTGPFTITDSKLGVLSPCGGGSLAPGATIHCAAFYAVTQADLDAGRITNSATASADNAISQMVTATVTAVQTKTLSLTAHANPTSYSAADVIVTYTYSLSNTGNVTLSGPFTVTDSKLGAISPCGVGLLAPQTMTTCSAFYTVTQADLDAGTLVHSAIASGNGALSPSATVTVTAVQTRALSLTVHAHPTTYNAVGAPVTYTYIISNTGNVTLSGPFTVTDSKLGAISPCGAGPLAPQTMATCSAPYTVTQADLDAGTLVHSAIASGNGALSPSATVTVTAVQTRALSLTVHLHPATYNAVGVPITYTYIISNTGNVTLSGLFTVTDSKLGAISPCGAGPLAPQATTTCSASYIVIQTDVEAGSITNHAAVTGDNVTSPLAAATVTAIQTKALSLTVRANTPAYAAVGIQISFTYTISNAGNLTLSGLFTVTDGGLGMVIPCGAAPLAPGVITRCTGAYITTQADLDAGSVASFAVASANGVTSPLAGATVIALQTKAISLTKRATPILYDAVGNPITYTYTISNAGNVTLSGPFKVVDSKLGVISPCGAGPLAPRATASCMAVQSITQLDLDAGSIFNSASASGNGVTSLAANALITAVQKKSLLLTVHAGPPAYAMPGDRITYTYTVQNVGNVTLAGPFTVTDNKLGTIQPCGAGPLAPGAATLCTTGYTVTQADIDAGAITNMAAAAGNGVNTLPVTATVTGIPLKSLGLIKRAAPMIYNAVGDHIIYTYTITNLGNQTLHGPFVVTDNKLGLLDPCGAGSLAPKAAITCVAKHTITQADLDAGAITNSATAQGNGITSPTAAVTVTARQNKALALAAQAGANTYRVVGTVISYSFTISNVGNVTLAGPFSIVDNGLGIISPCGAEPLTPGATTQCTAVYAITQADLDEGSVTMRAVARGDGVIAPAAIVIVTARQNRALALAKRAHPTTYSLLGSPITYTYIITNIGNVTLSGPFTVNDDKLGVISDCGAGPLAPGATTRCTAIHAVTVGDFTTGLITNSATVQGDGVASPAATATVTATGPVRFINLPSVLIGP